MQTIRAGIMLSLALIGSLYSQQATIESLDIANRVYQSAMVSRDGRTVVATAQTFLGTPRAVIWRENEEIALMDIPDGFVSSLVRSLSEDERTMVGSVGTADEQYFPVRWRDSICELLPLPDGVNMRGVAHGASRDGKIIVGTAGPHDSNPWNVCIWRDDNSVEVIPESRIPPRLNMWLFDSGRPAISPDGSAVAFGLVLEKPIHYWTRETGLLNLKAQAGTYVGEHPSTWGVTFAGNGNHLIGKFRSGGKVFDWNEMDGGIPRSVDVSALSERALFANDSANLLLGTAADGRSSFAVPPYGPLRLDELLEAQGADLSRWRGMTNISSTWGITNISHISPDGRWLVGISATFQANGGLPYFHGVYRAQLVLHSEGPTQLKVISSSSGAQAMNQLRWPATDLLVQVESAPAVHPDVPWQPETGSPRIEDDEIVLDLERVTERRFYRLRRLF